MIGPLNRVPETDSESRMHELDQDCWCSPVLDVDSGVVTGILHATNVHVLPVGDVVEHDEEGVHACICGPNVETLSRDDDTIGRLITHHSLDGRELRESS